MGLKVALKDANDQCILLFNEVQKAWKVSFTLQADLKVLFWPFVLNYYVPILILFFYFIINLSSYNQCNSKASQMDYVV